MSLVMLRMGSDVEVVWCSATGRAVRHFDFFLSASQLFSCSWLLHKLSEHLLIMRGGLQALRWDIARAVCDCRHDAFVKHA